MLRTEQECLECFRNQIRRTAYLQGCSTANINEILIGVEHILESSYQEYAPPEIAGLVYRYLAEKTGVVDPYKEIKTLSTEMMLAQYSHFKRLIENSQDPLKQAILFAGMGNAIDYGADPEFNINSTEMLKLNIRPYIFDYQKFRERLKRATTILYLADNTGETIFDRILIEALDKKVTYAVKSFPIINDALKEDAIAAGIDQIAEIVESGTFCPGTILHTCTDNFQQLFWASDLIISKGQGNYEALCYEDAPIFFLLKVKCALISRHLQAPVGSLVLKSNLVNPKNDL
jgi:uncharacterized protein with ATP-grasp and redox domains